MKGTIKIDNTDAKKLLVACEVNSIKIKNRRKVAEKSMVELDFKSPSDLWEAGRLVDKVSGSELDPTPEESTALAEKAKVEKVKKA